MLDGAPEAPPDPARGAGRRLALGLVLWAGLAVVSLVGSGPPPLLPSDAPAHVASGSRALQILRRLARDGEERLSPSRPVGSTANARCRERLLVECRRVGLFPEVDERFAVSTYENVAGTTRNVVARMRGTAAMKEPGRAILCMAHYDSVGAGPGIGDDLAGVAALVEVARALKANGITRRDVIFLFEDAEEHGLLGAEAFAEHHPWAEDVGFVINLEARGTTGPSRLFETGAGNAWSVEAFAETWGKPSASSVSVEVYRRMPNDTDYTVWRQRGIPGLNFAFIGDVTRYHTPLDDIQHLSPRSLQHHASNALAAIRALDDAEFPIERGAGIRARGADVVFFDVAGRWLATIRVSTMRLLAGLVLLLALVGVGRGFAAGALRGSRVIAGLVLVAAGLGAAAFIAHLDRGLMGLLGAPAVAFPAHMAPVALSLVGATVGGLGLVAGGLGRLTTAAECGAAVLLAFAFGGFALAWEVPGAAYLLVLPTIFLATAATVMRTGGDIDARWGNASLLPLATAALLWTGLHAGVVAGFGVASAFVVAVPLLVVGAFALPLLVHGWSTVTPWATAGGFAVGLVSAAFSGTLEAHSPDRPGRLNLIHVQAKDEPSYWQVMGMGDPLERRDADALRLALGLPAREVAGQDVPWAWSPLFAARALPIAAPEPTFEVLSQRTDENGDIVVEARVQSPRGGHQLVIECSGAKTMRVGGIEVFAGRFGFLGPGPEGYVFELTFGEESGGVVAVHDKRFGLDGVLATRAEPYFDALPDTLVPSHDGDGSLLTARYVLLHTDGDAMAVSRMIEKPESPDANEGDDSE